MHLLSLTAHPNVEARDDCESSQPFTAMITPYTPHRELLSIGMPDRVSVTSHLGSPAGRIWSPLVNASAAERETLRADMEAAGLQRLATVAV